MINRNAQAINLVVIFCFALAALSLFLFKLPTYIPFLLFLAITVLIITFINTDLALIILIFSMLLSPELKSGGVYGRQVVIRSDDIFLFIVFFGWLAKMAINKELGLIRFTVLNRPILIYFFFCLVSTLLGIIRGDVVFKETVFYLLKYLEYFILFFMISNNLKNMSQIKIFIYLMLLVCFIVSLFAWKMHLAGAPRVTAPFEGEEGEPNTLAGYLLLMMALMLGLILHTRKNRQRLVIFALLLMTIPPFLFTLSRGAWVAFIPMYLSLIIISRRGRELLLFVLIMVIITSPYIFPAVVTKRVKSTFTPARTYTLLNRQMGFDESTAKRIESWKYAFEMWTKRPILGYGVPAGMVIDNQYARVLREVGMLGFMAFIWLMIVIFRTAYHTYRSCWDNDLAKGVAMGFIAGFIGLLTQALTVETFIIIRIMEPFWFLAAIVTVLPEIANPAQSV